MWRLSREEGEDDSQFIVHDKEQVRSTRTNRINDGAHLVQLFRTDVGAICKAEIDETECALEIRMSNLVSLAIAGRAHELKGAPDTGPPYFLGLCLCCFALGDLLTLTLEVPEKPCARHEKQCGGANVEWLGEGAT